jgi:hypothetical protein
VNNKQAELKQRAAAATDWASVVEKLSIRLKQQAVAARAEALARTVEELRSRHTGLPVRMADSEFDRVWYGHCPDEAAPNRLLKNWGARLTLEHESDSCAVERAAGGIHARFGYTDR